MIPLILLFLCFLGYQMLVKGFLWKCIICIFGWYGAFVAMSILFPYSIDHGVSFGDILIPFCWVVPSILVLLAAAYTRDDE